MAAALLVLPALARPLPADAALTGRVDLRVLVVAAGNRSEDNALELMVRVLDRMGVPYDVLDARRDTLTDATLYAAHDHGRYNGIVLTVSDLYQPGGGSGFTADEWQRLHTYERTFGVREAVVSGYPTWDPALGLDYGMGAIGTIGSSSASWVAPAGGTELFEFVNTANPFPITDFAFTGVPRNDPAGPVVTPLLVHPADGSTLIARLTYADGREVLLSTIANAWYFLHSTVLAYEFVNFATRGLFIGGRQVHLSVHVDDLFIADDLWDPVANAPTAGDYRMSPGDVTVTVANQNQVRAVHPLAAGFFTQFAFNGYGAGDGTRILPDETYGAVADAQVRSTAANANYGASPQAAVHRTGARDVYRYLVRFDDQLALGDPTIASATLTVTGFTNRNGTRPARACRITEAWTEGTGNASGTTRVDVSWNRRAGTTRWTTAGASYDPANCVDFALAYRGATSVDITPIFARWAAGEPDHGVVIMATSAAGTTVNLRTREAGVGQPTLTLSFPTTPADPLTSAIVANRNQFGFINHTYATRQMDRVCPEEPNPQPPLCNVTNLVTATNEIARNRIVWQRLGLPRFEAGSVYLLSDSHAGLHDRRSTEEDPTDDIAYPEGKNDNFFQAMQNLGVRYIASDSSRPGQEREATAPGFDVFVSPRYPTAIWTNSSTPAENTDQYNWIFHERYLADGQNPCDIPAAICIPRTYDQILAAEADLTTLHMVLGSPWPHYMHQINLRAYDGSRQLAFDWLAAVLDRYQRNLTLPIVTLEPWVIGDNQRRLAEAAARGVRGTLDLATGVVTLTADGPAQPTITGLAGGSLYGGQYQSVVAVSPTPTTHLIDPATDR